MGRYLPAFFLALTLPAAGQAVVSPKHFALAEGNYSLTKPFSTTQTPFEFLQVHGDLAGQARTFNSISFRRDGLDRYSTKASVLLVDLFLSTAKTKASAPNKVFAQNHGADKTQVAAFRQVNFPATKPGDVPAPFAYKIAFQKPFAFGGKGPLCWEIKINMRQNTQYNSFDACRTYDSNPRGFNTSSGTACKAGGYTRALYFTGYSNMNWTSGSGSFSFNASYCPKSSAGFILMGINRKSFGGIPLPLEIPFTKGSKSGTCYLGVAPLFFLPAFSSSAGTISNYSFGFSTSPVFNGVGLYTQLLFPDAKANPFGIVTSKLANFHLLAPFKMVPVGYVYLAGGGTTGRVYANYGLIVKFE